MTSAGEEFALPGFTRVLRKEERLPRSGGKGEDFL